MILNGAATAGQRKLTASPRTGLRSVACRSCHWLRDS
jgi:hypothetical protein